MRRDRASVAPKGTRTLRRRGTVQIAAAVVASLLLTAGSSRGESGLSFLKIGVGARAVAMGNAVVSHVDGPSATYWNPGALPLARGSAAELGHNETLDGIRYEFVSLSHVVEGGSVRHGLGLSFNGVWTDRMKSYDETGRFIGDFGYYGLALAGSYGVALTDRFGLGVSVEYLREAIDIFNTDGLGLTAGCQLRELLPRTDVGAALLHLGSAMKYEEREFDLPTTVQAGISHRLPLRAAGGSLLVSGEVRKARDEDTQLLFGSEYQYQDLARLQVGYRTALDTEDVSLGVGLGNGRIRGQYAFVPFGENLGDQHRLSLLIQM